MSDGDTSSSGDPGQPLEQWQDALTATFRASPAIQVYRNVRSTQDAARRLIDGSEQSMHGAIIVADEQTAGRGRHGRSWFAPSGKALLFSVIVGIPESQDTSHWLNRLSLATGWTMRSCLSSFIDSHVATLKWPNDVMVDGRKIAGILIETASSARSGMRYAVVGIGVNTDLEPSDFAEIQKLGSQSPTSLRMLGRRRSRLDVLQVIFQELFRSIDSLHDETFASQVTAAWKNHCGMFGRRYRFSTATGEIEGEVIDIDADVGLIVRQTSGEIVQLPPATTSVL